MNNCFKTLFYSLVVICLSSCNSDDINQPENRNKDWVWFVEKGKSKGRWIKLDYSKNSNLLANGDCTLFYNNGIKREQYKLDKYGYADTTFCFNLKGEPSHYYYQSGEEIINYIYNQGSFTAFLADTSISLTGITVNHELTEIEWHEKMGQFIELVKNSKNSWDEVNVVFAYGNKIIRGSEGDFILKSKVDSLKNLVNSKILLQDSLINYCKKLEVDKSIKSLKSETISFIKTNKNILNVDFKEGVSLLYNELTESEKERFKNLMLKILDKNTKSDNSLSNTQIQFIREMKVNDFYLKYSKLSIPN